jgi:hypothetical protein
VGPRVVGALIGCKVGAAVGEAVGRRVVGARVGERVGTEVGEAVGPRVAGVLVGRKVGGVVGPRVAGALVGCEADTGVSDSTTPLADGEPVGALEIGCCGAVTGGLDGGAVAGCIGPAGGHGPQTKPCERKARTELSVTHLGLQPRLSNSCTATPFPDGKVHDTLHASGTSGVGEAVTGVVGLSVGAFDGFFVGA